MTGRHTAGHPHGHRLDGVSDLPHHQRIVARERFVQAVMLGVHHAPEIHYTQGPARWQGITDKRNPRHGAFPHYADCSAFYSWAMRYALLGLIPGDPDICNGDHWLGGYTGTIATHGAHVHRAGHLVRGDAVLYGPGPTFEHVAGVVGHRNGVPMVGSHGSEAGPFLLPYNYRPDVGMFRRII